LSRFFIAALWKKLIGNLHSLRIEHSAAKTSFLLSSEILGSFFGRNPEKAAGRSFSV